MAVIAMRYLTLSRLLDTSKKFAPRTYRFSQMNSVAFLIVAIITLSGGCARRYSA